MHTTSKFLIGALTAALTLPVWAATIIVDNNPSPTGVEVVSFTFENDVLTIITNGDNVIGPADGGGDPPPPPPPPPTDGPVSINSVSSNFTTVPSGQQVRISWSTTNAVACTPTKGNAEWQQQTISPLDSGSVDITIDHVGEVLYRLRCEGSAADDVRYLGVRITGTEPEVVGESSCNKTVAERPLYNGVSRAVSWGSIFGTGETFPDPLYVANANIAVPKGSYTAVRFNSGNSGGGGVSLANTNPLQWALASVSPCEGDFDVPEACRDIVNTTSDGGLAFTTESNTNYCQLAPNTEYFLNLTYGTFDYQELGVAEICTNSTCPRFELQYSQLR